jgi:hypothetical protein
MEFPFSIYYVWHAPHKLTDKPFWQEELRADYQHMAIYAANLLYRDGVPSQDSIRERPVIKVVRQGQILLALPDAHTVELCEKQVARRKEHPHELRPLFGQNDLLTSWPACERFLYASWSWPRFPFRSIWVLIFRITVISGIIENSG